MSWEVRSPLDSLVYSVERGAAREGTLEVAARDIVDYGLACVIEAAMNFRDGTVE